MEDQIILLINSFIHCYVFLNLATPWKKIFFVKASPNGSLHNTKLVEETEVLACATVYREIFERHVVNGKVHSGIEEQFCNTGIGFTHFLRISESAIPNEDK